MKYKNNPLNIRYDKANLWIGQIEPLNGFCQFDDLYYGFRAALKIFLMYRKRGIKSVSDIISQWAPIQENDSVSYYRFVSKYMNVTPSFIVPCERAWVSKLFCAMFRIEQGVSISSSEKMVLDSVLINLLPK